MKQPRPWFWKKRQAWYVTLYGKQIRLHENEKEANREYYRLMAAEGRLDLNGRSRTMMPDAIEALLDTIGHLRPNTRRMYVQALGPFAVAFQNRRIDSIRAPELIKFVAEYDGSKIARVKSFGQSSRASLFRHIKCLFRWARDTGLVQEDPLARVVSPWKVKTRERPMDESEYLIVMADRRLNARFKEVMEIMWRTGMRPGEVAALSARHLDSKLPMARFQPTEHKTGSKTGLHREVFFPDELMERMRDYAAKRPQGPLLRNRSGNPWSSAQIGVTFWRTKRRLGLKSDLVIYMTRHGFITRMIESGVPIARVAKIAGHNSTHMIMKNYYHPDTTAMVEAVEAIDRGATLLSLSSPAADRLTPAGPLRGPDSSRPPTDLDEPRPSAPEAANELNRDTRELSLQAPTVASMGVDSLCHCPPIFTVLAVAQPYSYPDLVSVGQFECEVWSCGMKPGG